MIYCYDMEDIFSINTDGEYVEAVPYLDIIIHINNLLIPDIK